MSYSTRSPGLSMPRAARLELMWSIMAAAMPLAVRPKAHLPPTSASMSCVRYFTTFGLP